MNQKYLESLTQFQTLIAAVLEIQQNLQVQQEEPSHDSNNQQPQHENNNLNNNSQHSLYTSRISKVEFRRFDGTYLKEWLFKCEQFFTVDNTLPKCKVRLASMHLSGSALQWHLNYMKGRFQIFPDWQQYISDITLTFDEVCSDPSAKLISIKHVGRVQDYIDAFELALPQVKLT